MSENSSKNFTLYPLLWLAVCFAAGILLAKYLWFGWQISLAVCLFSGFCSLIFIKQKQVFIFPLIAFLAAGALYFQIENLPVAENRLKNILDTNKIESGEPMEIEGVVRSALEHAPNGFFLILKIEKIIYKGEEFVVSGNVRLFVNVPNAQFENEYENLNLQYGSRIRAACILRRDEGFLNPGVVSPKEILDQKDIDATAILKSPLLVENIGEAEIFSPFKWIYAWRQNLIEDFRWRFSVSTAGVLIASLLGNQYFLDKNTAEVFRDGGTFHILVISGLHITFIGGLTLLLVRFFTRKRFWQFAIASGFLWMYSLAVGADIPVVRAAIMFTILLFSQVIFRKGTLLNALGACVLILLIWRPADIFTASFQLTIVSVTAIVAMAFPLIEKLRAVGNWSPSAATPFPPNVPVWLKRFCETLYWREAIWKRELSRQVWSARLFKSPHLKWMEKHNLQNPLRYIFEAILVSLIVQAWLLPFLVIYFHRFSLAATFLNLWVGIVIALESFAAIFAVLLGKINDYFAVPFVLLTEVFNWLLINVPQLLTENNWSSARIPHYSGDFKIIYFLYFIPIIVLTVVLARWNLFALKSKAGFSKLTYIFAAIFLTFAGLIIFHPFSAPKPDGKLHVEFLDVGQGDSIFITFPDGETMLVDGGGRLNFNEIYIKNEFTGEPELFEPDTPSIGETVVSAFLWEKGFDKVDYILATHADADHIQGLIDVAKNFRVEAAMFGRAPSKNPEFAELDSILQKRGIERVMLSRGDILNFGGAKIEVLFPASTDEISDNNHSVVLRVVYGERKFLLTGDIEKEAENELLQMPEFLRADVVKVPHHGSRTSSTAEFVSAAQAKTAIIPVGKNSPFGHPHEEVVERWRNAGAEVLTTGERGTISISTDGKNLEVKTFVR